MAIGISFLLNTDIQAWSMAEKAYPWESWVSVQALSAVHDAAAHRFPECRIQGTSC